MTETIPEIECAFHDIASLHESYMPFLINSGLFIRTNHNYPFGSEVQLTVKLVNEDEPFIVQGKIVWITPKGAQGNKPPGIGVQFVGDNSKILTAKIETHLAGMLNSAQVTDTI